MPKQGNNKENSMRCYLGQASFSQTDSKEMQQLMECISVCAACSKSALMNKL